MNDEELEALLADRALWVEPAPGLEDKVVAAVTAESTGGTVTSPAPVQARRRSGRLGVLVAAAIGLIAGAASVGLISRPVADRPEFVVALQGTELAPTAQAKVDLTRHEGGWRVYLDGQGLPRRSGNAFYEAWLKDDAGKVVSIGTFNEPRDVTLWAGISPVTHETLTITRELADGNAASSGRVVMTGQVQKTD